MCKSMLLVQFSRSVVSDSLRPHGLQCPRLPCISPTPGAYSNSCPLHPWCHPTISSSVVPSPPTFNPSQHQGLFKWISSFHQVAKVLEFQLRWCVQEWFPIGWTGWISLQSKGLSRVFFIVQLSHLYLTTDWSVRKLACKQIPMKEKKIYYEIQGNWVK